MNKLIKAMNSKRVLERMGEIKNIINGTEPFNIDELTEEMDLLEERSEEIAKEVEKRNALEQRVMLGGTLIPRKGDDVEEKRFGLDSTEYRNAFLKTLRGEELTEVEKRAYVHNTVNSSALLPKELEDAIYTNMEEQHPILKDVKLVRSGTSMSIVKHTTINKGDAKSVAEGEANDDEQNTFASVTLSGKLFSKHIDFTYELNSMAISAFLPYIASEIAARLGSAMANDIIETIRNSAEKGIATSNKFAAKTPGTLDIKDVLKGLGLLKGAAKTYVYANSSTLYNDIAAMEGKEGLVGFIPNHQENISGQLLGKGIKEEDALADGEVLILDPQQFLYNVVKDITLETDRDIKKGVNTLAGHAIAGGSMTNDKAGAIITVGTAV